MVVWVSKSMMTLDTTCKKKVYVKGDPISPIMFSIVVDMLEILFKRAKDEEQIMEGGHPVTWR